MIGAYVEYLYLVSGMSSAGLRSSLSKRNPYGSLKFSYSTAHEQMSRLCEQWMRAHTPVRTFK